MLLVRFSTWTVCRSATARSRRCTARRSRCGAGQIVSVIGPNGAGKSTLLNAIMGALPTTGHAKGAVLYQGEDVSAVPVEKRVARGMCLVPEKRELFASMTVEDNLVLGAYRRKRAGERNFLDQLEPVFTLFPRLKERRKQAAGTLSGGERQMLAVGRALMGKPRSADAGRAESRSCAVDRERNFPHH